MPVCWNWQTRWTQNHLRLWICLSSQTACLCGSLNIPSPERKAGLPFCQSFLAERPKKTLYLPVCRNWQTRQTQNLLSAMACGFESHHRHHESGSQNLYLSGLGAIFILPLRMRREDTPPFCPQWLACRSCPDGHKYLPLC